MIGQTLGHYRIDEQLGAGGMGVVYQARDLHLGRDVALKVLRDGLLADAKTRRRFRREALALAKLNHPNISTLYDFDTEGGLDFLTMELVPGGTLREKLAAGPLPEEALIRLGAQLALLPYQMALKPPLHHRYALGYYRPGEWAPKLHYQIPLNAKAAAVQAGVMTGAFFIFP